MMLGLFQGHSDLQPESGNKTQRFEAQVEAKLVTAGRPIVLDGNVTWQADSRLDFSASLSHMRNDQAHVTGRSRGHCSVVSVGCIAQCPCMAHPDVH